MKYKLTDTHFHLKLPNGLTLKVMPVNGELLKNPQLSWSHGFTQYKSMETNEVVARCGINYFEENAREVS